MVMAIFVVALLTLYIGQISANDSVRNIGLIVAGVLAVTGLLRLTLALSDWLWSAPFAWGW